MSFDDVSIDIETIGTSSTSAIASIGAAFFDINTGQIGARFYQVVDIADSLKHSSVDGDTIKWWMQQSSEARAVFIAENQGLLKPSLVGLSRFFLCHNSRKPPAVWGNGPSFDNTVLVNAYKAVGLDAPWRFWQDRDVRTMVDIGRRIYHIDPKKSMAFEGIQHNALHDAIHQAKYVSAIYNAMKESRFEKEKTAP